MVLSTVHRTDILFSTCVLRLLMPCPYLLITFIEREVPERSLVSEILGMVSIKHKETRRTDCLYSWTYPKQWKQGYKNRKVPILFLLSVSLVFHQRIIFPLALLESFFNYTYSFMEHCNCNIMRPKVRNIANIYLQLSNFDR